MKQKRIYRLVIFIFLVVIFLPSVGLFQKTDEKYIEKNLNRMPYLFPEWHLNKLNQIDFPAIEKWYGDKASFISTLSKIWSDTNYYFGISAKPNSVIIGKNGWFFTGNDAGHNVNLYTGKEVPTEEDIIFLVNGLKRMNETAKQYHVPFVVLVAPEAIDIYPEYLPNYLQKKSPTYTFEQISHLLPQEGIDFIDLRPTLIQAKNQNKSDLYLKGDAHWNYLGAYIAYQTLAKDVKLKYGLSLDRNKLTFSDNKMNAGSFANDLQRDDIWSTRADPNLSNVNLLLVGKDTNGVVKNMEPLEGNDNHDTRMMPYENINLLADNHDTCLLISDSYAEAMGVYFHNDFYDTVRIHYYNTSFNLSQLIQRYHPKLIVFEITSRGLYKFYNDFTPHTELLDKLQYNTQSPVSAEIQSLSVVNDEVKINGWGYIPNQDAANSKVYLKLLNDKGKAYYYLLKQGPSLDLKKQHTDGLHMGAAGFSGVIAQSLLPAGNYKASIIVKNGGVSGEKTFDAEYSISYKNPTSQTNKLLSKLDNFDSKKVNDEEIERKNQFRKKSSDFTQKSDNIDLQLLNIPLNKEVKIVPNMPHKIMFFKGWGNIEDWGIWSEGKNAGFIVSSKNLPEKYKILISYVGYTGPSHPQQLFEFYNIHGKLLNKASFKMGEKVETVSLNINQKEDLVNGEYLPILIKILDPISPSIAFPPSPDTRLLGLGLISIKVEPTV